MMKVLTFLFLGGSLMLALFLNRLLDKREERRNKS
jgi:hypothetical protein